MKRAIIIIIGLTVFGSVKAQNIIRPKIYCPNGIAINSYSGVLTYNRTDVSIPGRSMPLEAGFYYNSSANEENYRYGNGWSLGYEFRYKTSHNDSIITIRYGNGRGEDYTIYEGVYKPPVGVFNTLTYQGGVVTLTTREGQVYRFEDGESKKLTGFADRNGNAIHFEYTAGKLTRMSDDAGRGLVLEYNAEGYLSRLTDPAGRQWHYAYDENGNLTSVTNPANHSVHYGYNKENRLSTFTDPEGHSTWVTYNKDGQAHRVQTELTDKSIRYEKRQRQTVIVDYMGEDPEHPGQELPNQFTTYKWDTLGRVIEKTGNCCGSVAKYEYDENNNVLKSEDANGNVTEYTYDANGNVLSVKDPLGYVESYTYSGEYGLLETITERGGAQYTFRYNSNGKMTKVEGPDGVMMQCSYNTFGQEVSRTDAMGNMVTRNYDNYGNLATITNSIGKTLTYSHDILGQLRSVKSPLENMVFYDYDEEGNVTKITDPYNVNTYYDYAPTGHIKAIRSARGKVQYSQDALGRLTSVRNDIGNTTIYNYDSKGNITAVTDAMGNTTHYEYDGSNNCTVLTDPMGNKTHYSFDAKKRMTGIRTPDGRQTNYEYDARGQLVKISDNLGMLARINYDAAGRRAMVMKAKEDNVTVQEGEMNTSDYDIYTYAYDIRGRMTMMQTPTTKFTYSYDRLGRCTGVSDDNGHSVTYTYNNAGQLLTSNDSRGNTVNYTYDALGRIVTHMNPEGNTTQMTYDSRGRIASVSDTRGNETHYNYDSRGRLVQTLYANGKMEQYTYDERDNIVTYKNKAGINYRYGYDEGNRLVSITFPDNSTKLFTYDALGRTTAITENDMSVTMSYDAQGRILAETLYTSATAPTGRRTEYDYDDALHTFTVTYPSGRRVSQRFDDRGRLTEITTAAYGETGWQTVASYAYEKLNRIESISYANGLTTSYGYDMQNRLSDIVVGNGTSQTAGLHYNYATNVDYIMSQTDVVNPTFSEFYEYDMMGRLVSLRVGEPDVANPALSPSLVSMTSTFTYDALGNRTNTMTQTNEHTINTSYTVNAVNAYTAVGGQVIQYDAAGNLTADGNHTYQYDYANRLVAVDNGNTAQYTYDPLGRRIRKVVGDNEITDYSYSGGQVVESSRRVGSGEPLITSYVNNPQVDDVVAGFRTSSSESTAVNETYFFHKNRQGSTVAVTDASGTVLERYSYEAFGTPCFFNASGEKMVASAIGNDILFTGREYDPETGFYYYRFRTMNSAMGRFIQNDPVKYADGMNMYAYAHNNPTNIVDPLGLSGCDGNCAIKPPRCMLWPWMCETERFSEFSSDMGINLGAGAFAIVGGNIQFKIGINTRDVETPWGTMPWVDFYLNEHVTAGGGIDVQASAAIELGWNENDPYSINSITMGPSIKEIAFHAAVGGISVQLEGEGTAVENSTVTGGLGPVGYAASLSENGMYASTWSLGAAKDNIGAGFHVSHTVSNGKISTTNAFLDGLAIEIMGFLETARITVETAKAIANGTKQAYNTSVDYFGNTVFPFYDELGHNIANTAQQGYNTATGYFENTVAPAWDDYYNDVMSPFWNDFGNDVKAGAGNAANVANQWFKDTFMCNE